MVITSSEMSGYYLNTGTVTLFHGSKDSSMLPAYKTGTYDRDFGIGFYTTLDPEMAKAWAYESKSSARFGYIHSQDLGIINLQVLDFKRLDSLYWLAEVIRNRYYAFKANMTCNEFSIVSELLDQYLISKRDCYDVIIGCSTDNGLFDYACKFICGNISKEMFDIILKQYSYCMQVCLKSKRAFQALSNHSVKRVPVSYREQYRKRDMATRKLVSDIRNSGKRTTIEDYLITRRGVVAFNVGTDNFVQATSQILLPDKQFLC